MKSVTTLCELDDQHFMGDKCCLGGVAPPWVWAVLPIQGGWSPGHLVTDFKNVHENIAKLRVPQGSSNTALN